MIRSGILANSTTACALDSTTRPLPSLELHDIHWAIVGGESGPGARPMLKTWVTDIQRQCKRAGVPFFFKQWGGVHKKKNGRLLQNRTWDELPRTTNMPVVRTA